MNASESPNSRDTSPDESPSAESPKSSHSPTPLDSPPSPKRQPWKALSLNHQECTWDDLRRDGTDNSFYRVAFEDNGVRRRGDGLGG